MAILLIFAHESEACTTIELLNAHKIEENYFIFAKGIIVISGIGSNNALLTATKYLHHVDEIWNAGFAASLKQDSGNLVGDIYEISWVEKFIHVPDFIDDESKLLMQRSTPKLFLQNMGKKLITCDFPIHDQRLHAFFNQADLIDMEGYGIAIAARYFQKPCKLIKIVSDFAKNNGRSLISQYKKELADLLAEQIQKYLCMHKLEAEKNRHS